MISISSEYLRELRQSLFFIYSWRCATGRALVYICAFFMRNNPSQLLQTLYLVAARPADDEGCVVIVLVHVLYWELDAVDYILVKLCASRKQIAFLPRGWMTQSPINKKVVKHSVNW